MLAIVVSVLLGISLIQAISPPAMAAPSEPREVPILSSGAEPDTQSQQVEGGRPRGPVTLGADFGPLAGVAVTPEDEQGEHTGGDPAPNAPEPTEATQEPAEATPAPTETAPETAEAPPNTPEAKEPAPDATESAPAAPDTAPEAGDGAEQAPTTMAAAAPPAAVLEGPPDNSIIASVTPTLAVEKITATGIQYCFKIATGFDGRSGTVIDSGCLDIPQWTVPENILHSGGRYTWTVLTAFKGGTETTTPQWIGHFTVDQRIGANTISPTDSIGGVSVNLFNGNVHTSVSGPSYPALGGDAGVHFVYNSRQGEPHGLRASYYNDSSQDGEPDGAPVLVRQESQVNLNWGIFGAGEDNLPWKPNPIPEALESDWYVIRWEGYFQATKNGDYRFGADHVDGARIWVNNQQVYNNPNPSGLAADFFRADTKRATDITLVAGQRVQLRVELAHRSTERPKMVLWAKSTDSSGFLGSRKINWGPEIVKAERLFSAVPSLPAGWSLSVAGSGYNHAEYLDGSIVLTDASGATHTWAKTSEGGYAPPVDSDGVLAVDDTGTITLTEGEVVTVFNPDGTLATVSSVLDSKKPAALRYKYSGNPARLTQIEDPVSGRSHTLHYNTDNTNSCYGGATKPPGEVDDAPLGMLCRVTYWDGRETLLWYTYAASLSRIENPGKQVHDFQYVDEAKLIALSKQRGYAVQQYEEQITETRYEYVWVDGEYVWTPIEYTWTEYYNLGPISSLRDTLTYDWLARQTSDPGDKARTVIKYEPFYDSWNWPDRPIYIDGFMEAPPKFLRPQHISTAAADGSNAITGEGRWYDYGFDVATAKPVQEPAMGTGGVVITPSLPAQKVTFDLAGRNLTSTDADGVTNSAEWSNKDKKTAVVDGTGRRTTSVYDHADRLVDTFGPAPGNCFDGQFPTPACANTVPHVHYGYDEGMAGLQAQLYDNPSLSGSPTMWQTGVGTDDGALAAAWDANPPVPNDDGWSGRFTGEIQLPDTGDYKLGFNVVDGVRLWIDDYLVVDSWTDKTASTVADTYHNATPGSWHRVRIDYYNRSGDTGALNFAWMPPGTTTPVTVPGAHLRPRYGLETSKIGDNSNDPTSGRAPSLTVVNSYTDKANGIDPVLGLVTATVNDPNGLQLVRRNQFETPGQGYLRKQANAIPAGDITDPTKRGTYTYYGDGETRANPCDTGSSPVSQAGMVKTLTAAENADGTANTAETVYDAAGRIVATRINSEPWSCTSYDARGRTVEQMYPAMGDQPSRTITFDYAVNNNPLVAKVTDESGSTLSQVDLLGRVTSYTDTNGVVTTAKYDPYGRKSEERTTVGTSTSTLTYHWTNAGRLARQDLDGKPVATPQYTNGAVTGASYGNGSSLTASHNGAGSLSDLTWKSGGSTVTDAVIRARDQRVTDNRVTDSAGGTYQSVYAYDGVGRIVGATVPHHVLSYSYDADNGCGPNQKAGLNSNRTRSSDSFAGGPEQVTTYCYDHADRLLATTGAQQLAFAYDAYGNATTVGEDTLGYDSTRRHVSTTTGDGISVRYTRDVTDRIMMRSVQGNNNASTIAGMTRYGYTSGASGMALVLDGSRNLLQRIVQLPGGVVLTKNYTGTATENWSYPNIHGDILFTADGAGTRAEPIHLYDPFGQNIDPTTGEIGDIPVPETAHGGLDFGYLGQHTVPVEHLAGLQSLEMGARTYIPALGRFLQTDPITGGSANDYDYANADPINSSDLTGKLPVAVVPLIPVIVDGAAALATLMLHNKMKEEGESSESAPSKVDTDRMDDDTLFHYTNKEGFEAAMANPATLRANERGRVYATRDMLSPEEAEQALFVGNPAYAGKGDYVIIFNPQDGQEWAPGDQPNELIHYGTVRIPEPDIIYAGPNPF
ncbi:PA14 domain-containing protein [Nocardia testacea]|uniref:PA14 domain-containing protein n=1 Tax=Nocardia testacea TaxID=248551 RepID=UPI003A88B34B